MATGRCRLSAAASRPDELEEREYLVEQGRQLAQRPAAVQQVRDVTQQVAEQGARVAAGAAESRVVAAEALVAMSVGTPAPMASATAEAVKARPLGSLINLPLCISHMSWNGGTSSPIRHR